jgi:anaerobic carbon-monoxide dehydrogenase iron sulfur subunit
MEEKVLIADNDKCTGCRSCELACSMAHLGEFNPDASYIRILKNKEMDIHIVTLGMKCDHCGECVKVCLPGVLEFVPREEAIINWKGAKTGRYPAPLFRNQ